MEHITIHQHGGLPLAAILTDTTGQWLAEADNADTWTIASHPEWDALLMVAREAGWHHHSPYEGIIILHHCARDEFLLLEQDADRRWNAEPVLHLLATLSDNN